MEEFFNHTFDKMNDSFTLTLDNVIRILEDKIVVMKNLAKVGLQG